VRLTRAYQSCNTYLYANKNFTFTVTVIYKTLFCNIKSSNDSSEFSEAQTTWPAMKSIMHTRVFYRITRTREKPNPITAVVPQAWFQSPRESRVFRPQYRGNSANTATVSLFNRHISEVAGVATLSRLIASICIYIGFTFCLGVADRTTM